MNTNKNLFLLNNLRANITNRFFLLRFSKGYIFWLILNKFFLTQCRDKKKIFNLKIKNFRKEFFKLQKILIFYMTFFFII